MAYTQHIRESENHDDAGEYLKNPVDGVKYQFESDFYKGIMLNVCPLAERFYH